MYGVSVAEQHQVKLAFQGRQYGHAVGSQPDHNGISSFFDVVQSGSRRASALQDLKKHVVGDSSTFQVVYDGVLMPMCKPILEVCEAQVKKSLGRSGMVNVIQNTSKVENHMTNGSPVDGQYGLRHGPRT